MSLEQASHGVVDVVGAQGLGDHQEVGEMQQRRIDEVAENVSRALTMSSGCAFRTTQRLSSWRARLRNYFEAETGGVGRVSRRGYTPGSSAVDSM